tara:strand:+ start:250 stop:765 length:516 start_codon:yes stop_codon:yes gene_type:complete
MAACEINFDLPDGAELSDTMGDIFVEISSGPAITIELQWEATCDGDCDLPDPNYCQWDKRVVGKVEVPIPLGDVTTLEDKCLLAIEDCRHSRQPRKCMNATLGDECPERGDFGRSFDTDKLKEVLEKAAKANAGTLVCQCGMQSPTSQDIHNTNNALKAYFEDLTKIKRNN